MYMSVAWFYLGFLTWFIVLWVFILFCHNILILILLVGPFVSRDLNEIEAVADPSTDDSIYYELSMNAINSSAATK